MQLTQLLNSTNLGEVAEPAKLRRHRILAGLRIAARGDERAVDLVRYVAWLVGKRHEYRGAAKLPVGKPAAEPNVNHQHHEFHPNPGSQSDFLRSRDQFPMYAAGLGAGKTWAGSAKLVTLHMQRPGVNSLAVEPTYSNLRQIMLPAICERLDEIGIPYTTRTSDVFEIHTPTLNSKFLLHSGLNAERIAGFECGQAWIDEPARIPEFSEPKRRVWTNVIARVRDARVPPEARISMLTGTHEGRGTWCWRDWEKTPKRGHVIFRGTTWDNPDAQEYAQTLIDEYGPELAEQYVKGGAADDSMPAIPWHAIEAMQDGTCRREPDWAELQRAESLYVGVDIGRSQSLTVFWIADKRGDKLHTLACIELRRAEFQTQWSMFERVMGLPGIQKLSIDATYNPQTAEDACRRWGQAGDSGTRGGRIDPVTFSAAVKFALVEGLIKTASKQTMKIPDDDEIALDFHSMKRVVKASGRVSYEAPFTSDGHADRFIAAALCVKASTLGGVEPFKWTSGPERRSRGMRRY